MTKYSALNESIIIESYTSIPFKEVFKRYKLTTSHLDNEYSFESVD